MLTTAPDKLDVQEGAFLAHLTEAAPDLTQAGELASLIRGTPDKGIGPALDTGLADAKGTALDAFACGIKRDHDAVLAAPIEPWGTGPVEEGISRLKLLKRTMYGRAGYDLLRCRVLAALCNRAGPGSAAPSNCTRSTDEPGMPGWHPSDYAEVLEV